MENKAVVLGSNYYIGLSLIRCLGINGITVVAIDHSRKDTYGSESKYCSERIIAPHYREETREFISFLKNYANKQSHPPVLFPSADPYVEVIDQHLEELKEFFLIPQTEPGLYTKTMNKEKLHKLAIEKGVAVPETVSMYEEDFLEKAENTLKFPCIVKPVDSHTFVSVFRRKMFKVQNREELETAVAKAKKAGLEVIVQRIIPGFDDHMYTFDAYLNQNAKITHWTTFQKYRQYPINFGASVYTTQKYVPELYEIGAGFLEAIKFKGFVEIEFKKDAETGKFYLIELNVRTTNFNQLLYKVGLNMPYIAYRDLTGNPLEPKAIKEDTNIVFWYAFEDLLAVKEYIKTGQLSLGKVLVSYFKPKAYAIWDWKDPKPAFSFLKIILNKVFRKISRK
ncbi:Predicted ATP-dependent carboligase, ATP-grasp superfamily [Natronincola peptidivorans]|uniref:Predicted ATP-dependent carboligase, ATP-grasp superfamily n=1 Tax=Natronincola peptidivorans TaxID=426128 RepID=A0A1H9YLP0_9FIRM|nr:carboxylate--amine ligase [Natronincola peptidivorans]SES69958.1 Predicted ATP-dependent carboligase, ATP-grasp superfamily [Natronincola peptidivorans]